MENKTLAKLITGSAIAVFCFGTLPVAGILAHKSYKGSELLSSALLSVDKNSNSKAETSELIGLLSEISPDTKIDSGKEYTTDYIFGDGVYVKDSGLIRIGDKTLAKYLANRI